MSLTAVVVLVVDDTLGSGGLAQGRFVVRDGDFDAAAGDGLEVLGLAETLQLQHVFGKAHYGRSNGMLAVRLRCPDYGQSSRQTANRGLHEQHNLRSHGRPMCDRARLIENNRLNL